MDVVDIDMQRISLGALIIALALLVDDAMTTTDAMVTRLAAGDEKEKAATYAFERYAMAMLAGTLVTIAGFVPIGFAASSAGEYTFSLFAVVSIALVISWLVAVVFAPVLGVAMLSKPKTSSADAPPGRTVVLFPAAPLRRHQAPAGSPLPSASACSSPRCWPFRWCRVSSSRRPTARSFWST